MSHRKLILSLALTAAVLVAVLIAGLNVWDGGLEFAHFNGGARKTLSNGLSLTVPAGRAGYYNRWAYLPEWMPVSWAKTDTPIRETWQVLRPESSDEPTTSIFAVIYHANATPPKLDTKRPVAEYDGIRVYSSQESSQAFAIIEVQKPGTTAVYFMTRIDSSDIAGSLRGLWAYLNIRGVPAP